MVKTKDEHGLPLNITDRTVLLLRKLDRVNLSDKREFSYRVPCFLRIDQDVQQQVGILHEIKEHFISANVDDRLFSLQDEQAKILKEERKSFDQAQKMFVEMLEQEEEALASCKTVHAANHGNRELISQHVAQTRQSCRKAEPTINDILYRKNELHT